MTTQLDAWDAHRRGCRRCQRQWKRWEDGDMTCDQGVALFMAARRAQEQELALFKLEETA